MSDLESLISDAVSDAEAGILEVPAAEGTPTDVSTTAETPETTEVSPTAVAEAAPAAPAVDDDLKKELEEAGYKPAQPGQRENRLPWSRVQKILENTRKKLKESHATATKEWETKYQTVEKRAKEADQWDQFIAADPDGSRTMQFLAQIHPQKFQRYLNPPTQPTTPQPNQPATPLPNQPTAADPTDPRPGPNAQYADGSMGYDEKGLEALMGWERRQAVREALGQFESRQKQTQEQSKKLSETTQRIQAENNHRIGLLKKAWGELYVQDDPEVVKLMSQGYPLETAAQIVWAPKQKLSKDAMRAELLKEIQTTNTTRKQAATKSTPASVPSTAPAGNRSVEDIVREALAASGLK